MLMLTKCSTDVLEPCKGYDFASTLNLTVGKTFFTHGHSRQSCLMPHRSIDAADSRLFGRSLPVTIKNALEKELTTANYHDFCMRPEVSAHPFEYLSLIVFLRKEFHQRSYPVHILSYADDQSGSRRSQLRFHH